MKKTKTRALSEKSRPAKKKNQAFRTYVVQKMRLIEYIVVLWLHHVDILLKASTPNFIELYLINDKKFDNFFYRIISAFENWNVVREVGVGSISGEVWMALNHDWSTFVVIFYHQAIHSEQKTLLLLLFFRYFDGLLQMVKKEVILLSILSHFCSQKIVIEVKVSSEPF